MTDRAQAVIERARALGVPAEDAAPMVLLCGKSRTVAECEAWLDGLETGWGAAVEIVVGSPADD